MSSRCEKKEGTAMTRRCSFVARTFDSTHLSGTPSAVACERSGAGLLSPVILRQFRVLAQKVRGGVSGLLPFLASRKVTQLLQAEEQKKPSRTRTRSRAFF